MTQIYQQFYREYGIRRLAHLLSPRLFPLRQLPRDSLVHVLNDDDTVRDIDVSKPYFSNGNKIVDIDYPTELAVREGNAHRNSEILGPLLKPFHFKNKKFKYVPDAVNKVTSSDTLLVLNYSYLNSLNRYPENPLNTYFKFFNNYSTMFKNIAKIAETKAKNHFIFIDLPKQLPSFSLLNLFVGKISRSILLLFKDNSSLFMLQFWQWLSDKNREKTIFGDLTPATLSKINLVFHSFDGRSIVMNLGYINSWLKGHESLKETGESQHVDVTEIQKLFLKFSMTLTAVVPEEEVKVDTTDTEPEDVPKVDDLDLDEEDEDEEGANPTDRVYLSGLKKSGTKANIQQNDINKKLASTDDDILSSMSKDIGIKSRLSDIDKELEILDRITLNRMKDHDIHLDKDGNELEGQKKIEKIPQEVLHNKIYKAESFEESLIRQLNDHAEFGLVTAADYKRMSKDIVDYKTSKDPYGTNQLTVEAMVVTSEDIVLKPEKTEIVLAGNHIDKTMGKSSLKAFNPEYIKHVMKKDVLAMVNAIQKAGVIVRGHEIEIEHSALGTYENHRLDLKPIDGQPSSIHFRIPQPTPDGYFQANGNKYLLRKQRVDLPIRKFNPFTVALTSYYGKLFITMNQKKVNNSLAWIVKEMTKASMEENHPTMKRVAPANVFDNNFEAPYIYNALSNYFKSLTTNKYHLVFDHSERKKVLTPESLSALEVDGARYVGNTARKEPIIVDKKNNFHAVTPQGKIFLGDIYSVLELHVQNAPLDFTEVKIFSKAVPVGVLLGYVLGFTNLLTFLEVKYEVMEGRRGAPLQPHQYAITFRDMRYIFDRRDTTSALILAGFTDFEKQLKIYEASEFDKKDIYLNLLESKGLGSIYIREIENLQNLFVDPITESILKEMKEPLTFNGLLVRSTEMLQTYHHPDTQDTKAMRFRGYERFAGAIYKELTTQIRSYKSRNIAGKSRIEMSPYQVWQAIMQDSALKLAEDINPIQNLKEDEIVTYVGVGGRNKDAMSKPSRAYHVNDMGVVSEATVDSSDVGINAYLSADPEFENLRGITKEKKDLNATKLMSSSAMLSHGVIHDDPKRVNFVSIQMGHNIATLGYRQSYIRTGYDAVISSRTSDMFASVADADGKVVSIDEHGIIVEYKDGTKKGVRLGRQYGKAEGSVYPHDIVTPMKAGQSFKKGDPIAYNTGFFEPDFYNPSRILMKNSMTAKVAFMEITGTHEDASIISRDLSKKLTARTTHVRSFMIDFKQNLVNVVKIDQDVNPKTVLMIIADEITSTADVFDQQSLETLERLSNQSPRANYLGKIDKIEVFYHGDKRDMSPSLKALADRSDKLMIASCKSSGNPEITGQVNDDYRVAGVPLALDKAEVKIYITVETHSATGDKIVFSHQLKSVTGEVMDYSIHTQAGEKVDACFSYRSVGARIVETPIILGTSITLLKKIGSNTVAIYRKK